MIKVGDAEIIRIEELMVLEPAATFAGFEKSMLAEHPWLVPNHYDVAADAFVTSIHVWLVKLPGRTIIIDTGSGNGKDRPLSPRFHRLDTPFLARLKAAGVAPEDVDLVLLTHLHIDHVGWNTVLAGRQWVPTFPNATYVMSRIERAWRDPALATATRPPAANLPFLDSVKPVIDAGLAKLVDGNEQIADGIDLLPTPGHAPGQMAIRIRSRGQEALFVADVMHQPFQVYYPAINSKYCEDQALAPKTRKWLLDYCADTGCLMLPAHFGAPFCGRITRQAEGFAFLPSPQMP